MHAGDITWYCCMYSLISVCSHLIQGYKTLSMHCEYQDSEDDVELGILETVSNSVRCTCHAIQVNGNSLSDDSGECVLSIFRCPTSLNLTP